MYRKEGVKVSNQGYTSTTGLCYEDDIMFNPFNLQFGNIVNKAYFCCQHVAVEGFPWRLFK